MDGVVEPFINVMLRNAGWKCDTKTIKACCLSAGLKIPMTHDLLDTLKAAIPHFLKLEGLEGEFEAMMIIAKRGVLDMEPEEMIHAILEVDEAIDALSVHDVQDLVTAKQHAANDASSQASFKKRWGAAMKDVRKRRKDAEPKPKKKKTTGDFSTYECMCVSVPEFGCWLSRFAVSVLTNALRLVAEL